MSTAAHTALAGDLARDEGPPLTRLIRVELRKMYDTRAGFWLLLGAAALTTLAAALTIFTGSTDGQNLANAMDNATQAMNFLVPVVGILLVTSEWSQRTAQVTFTLVPRRGRVLAAKVGASLVLALAGFVVTLVVSAIFTGLGGQDFGDQSAFDLSGGLVLQTALFDVISMLIGVGLGAAILLSAPAIVAAFVLPVGVSLICELISGLNDVANWIGQGEALSPLTDHTLSGTEWGRVVTASLLWCALPLTVGVYRFLRGEVR